MLMPFYTRTHRYPTSLQETERTHRLLVDAFVTDDAIVMTAAVPGLNLEDLEITMDDDVLIIRGEINGLEENADYVLRERFHGKFERRLNINIPVDINAAEATYENGILRLVLPKAEEAKPHRITVNAAN